MPLLPTMPPQPVPILSGFDYVTVDEQRRRVYAAHTGSNALTMIDADTGAVIGQGRVGPMHGVAVDPATGHVFTGNGGAHTVSEVDPEKAVVVRSAAVAGDVDAIAYDPQNGHIYADENDGTHVYVVDAKTMQSIGTVDLPGHKPEYLAIDPQTHNVYQNISDLSEFVIIDGTTLKVSAVVPTPQIKANHPLQYDPAYGHVLVGGQNGLLAAYDTSGHLAGTVQVQDRVDQCALDPASHQIACAGSGSLTLLRDNPSGAPTLLARAKVERGAHTVGIDPKTSKVWIVWSEPDGDFVQSFHVGTGTPPAD